MTFEEWWETVKMHHECDPSTSASIAWKASRNAALEEAAGVCEEWGAWNDTAQVCAAAIRLKIDKRPA